MTCLIHRFRTLPSLYLSTTEPRSGKSLVGLGILDLALKRTTKIAYFRPLDWLQNDNTLIITPGDRGDAILGMIQAYQSTNYPRIAGILLTTGFKPEGSILRLLEGVPDCPLLLSVNSNTYDTTNRLGKIYSSLMIQDQEKINRSIEIFEKYIDLDKLENIIQSVQIKGGASQIGISINTYED